jgi:hypothetical protein
MNGLETAGLLIIGGILGVGMLLVIHGTIFKTRWGIKHCRSD